LLSHHVVTNDSVKGNFGSWVPSGGSNATPANGRGGDLW